MITCVSNFGIFLIGRTGLSKTCQNCGLECITSYFIPPPPDSPFCHTPWFSDEHSEIKLKYESWCLEAEIEANGNDSSLIFKNPEVKIC
jgi:hypothetical protein